jgi:CheY-like chemotaxis protein
MGGVIEVESTIDRGSTFSFTLPVSKVARQIANAAVAAPLPKRALRVLVADDDLINQKVSSRLVSREGHDVTVAGDGKLALEAFIASEWDLVLMDVQMPVMDGLRAAAAIREFEKKTGRPPTPIIALTASVLPEEIGACLTAGMDEVLAKPVAKGALQEVLTRVGNRSSTTSSVEPCVLVA